MSPGIEAASEACPAGDASTFGGTTPPLPVAQREASNQACAPLPRVDKLDARWPRKEGSLSRGEGSASETCLPVLHQRSACVHPSAPLFRASSIAATEEGAPLRRESRMPLHSNC